MVGVRRGRVDEGRAGWTKMGANWRKVGWVEEGRLREVTCELVASQD